MRRGLVDFDDLLARCADAIEARPGFAAVQRWRWRHVFVDEFQDLNPLQHRLLMAWLGPSTDLCVVGDPHQAVYAWNGADADLLAQVPDRWPTTEVLYLDDNHRCTPADRGRRGGGARSGGHPLALGGRGRTTPEVRVYPTETAEAHGIAAGLRAAGAHGRRWASLAVLTRTNAQLIPIQEALAAAGIPFWSPARGASPRPAGRRRPRRDPPHTLGRPCRRWWRTWSPSEPARPDRRTARRLSPPWRTWLACFAARSPEARPASGWPGCRAAVSDDPGGPAPPTRSRCAASTGPRASNGTRCGSPASSRGWCRSGGPPPAAASRGAPAPLCGAHPGRASSCTARGPASARSGPGRFRATPRPGWS